MDFTAQRLDDRFALHFMVLLGLIAMLGILRLWKRTTGGSAFWVIGNSLLLAAATMVSVVFPISCPHGLALDLRSVLIPTAMIFLGPIPVLSTWLLALIYRIVLDGPDRYSMIMQVYFLISGVVFYLLRRSILEQFRSWGFLLLGLGSLTGSISVALWLVPVDLHYQYFASIPYLASYILTGIFLFGAGYSVLFRRVKAMQKSVLAEQRFHNILAASPDGYLLLEGDTIIEVNQNLLALWDVDRSQVIGHRLAQFAPLLQPNGKESLTCLREQFEAATEQENTAFSWVNLTRTGNEVLSEVTFLKLDGNSQPRYTAAFVRRPSERNTAVDFLTWYASIFGTSPEAVTVTDPQGNILYVNSAFEQLTGYMSVEVIGKNPRILKSNHHDSDFYKDMWLILLEQGEWEGEIWSRTKEGSVRPCRLRIAALRDPQGVAIYYVGSYSLMLDGSGENPNTPNLFDPLTRLDNRDGFLWYLGRKLEQIDLEKQSLAVVALNVVNFRGINNSFGHSSGDLVLKQIAERLQTLDSEHFHCARLGNDEFLVMIEQDSFEIQLQPTFESFIALFKPSMRIKGETVFIAATLGVAIAEKGASPESLLKEADSALHQAKIAKTPYVIYDGKMQNQAIKDLTLSKKLKLAIENNLIEVFYQPKIEISTGRISGMEALARWRDEQGKFIPPVVFIPLAEKNGLINHLFQVIVAKTIKDMSKVFLPEQPNLMVSINLSAHQFALEHLVQEIVCRIDHERISREHFEFEVTESVFIANMEFVRQVLLQFKQEGFQLALDDFGTGFSSLTYLNHLPFDTLKIDKSFVDPVPHDLRMNALTRSIVELSHSIDLCCVAEGVESVEQLEFLRSLGCDYFQGYLFSPPVDSQHFLALLKAQHEQEKC